jgi:nucleoside-diphosphate-sugar epimerase
LVTGGAGFIGRWVVARLLEGGHEVCALDDLSNGRRENLAAFEGASGFLGLVRADIKDRAHVAKVFNEQTWDRVFHLGASIHVQRSIDDPEVVFQNDAFGTFVVLQACRMQYFHLNGLDPNDRRFHLDEVRDRLSDRRPRIVVMSTCMVYATRDMLYVEDCAEFVVRVAESRGVEGQVVNAGTGRDIAVRDLARLCATGGNPIEHVPHDHPQAEIPRLLCNTNKAKALLEWRPAVSLEEGLDRTRAWLSQNRWAW